MRGPNFVWPLTVVWLVAVSAAMADRMGDRLASRLHAGNPELPEVTVEINTAEDYRA